MRGLYNKLKFDFKFDNEKQKILYSFDPDDEGPFFSEKMYGDFPSQDEYNNIGSLVFSILSGDINELKSLPGFVDKLGNLQTLSIPIDWLGKITTPSSLKVLLLTSPVANESKNFEWSDDSLASSLRYLKIPELVHPFHIDFEGLPHLEWIEIDLKAEKNENKLVDLAKLNTLKHLIFEHAKDFDIFSPFKENTIKSLEIFACIGKKFPIENVKNFSALKYLRINNISVPFDCNLLLELPNLIELDILNIKTVQNIENIIAHKSLKSLSVLNCNNPFKSAGKDIFKEKGYDHLSIDYA